MNSERLSNVTDDELVGDELDRKPFEGKLITPCCRVIVDGFDPNKMSKDVTCPSCFAVIRFTKNPIKGIIDAERIGR